MPENVPADSNGVDASQDIKQIQAAATRSTDQIAQDIFTQDILPLANSPVPLGDADPASSHTTVPASAPLPNGLNFDQAFRDLDSLDTEIQGSNLEGGKSPEQLRSFDGLKARYKNKITSAKQQLQFAQTQIAALTSQLTDLPKIKDNATKYEQIAPEVEKLEARIEELQRENESLSYYQRKYDFEKDPEVQREFLEPMTSAKSKSLDILQNHNLDEDFWDQLVTADSEYKVNSLIDGARISGLNGQSLKRHVSVYQQLKDELRTASAPETIEAAIDVARGRRIESSNKAAGQIFDWYTNTFSEWMSEIKENEINREHNFYVHDKAIEEAKKTYNSLRQAIPAEHLSKRVLEAFAKSSLMAAAYPLQRKLLDFLLKTNGELISEKKNSGMSLRQIRENPIRTNGIQGVEDIKKEATKSIDEITREAFQTR